MKTNESIQQRRLDPEGFNPTTKNPDSNFWGIVFMVLVFFIVIAALALLLL